VAMLGSCTLVVEGLDGGIKGQEVGEALGVFGLGGVVLSVLGDVLDEGEFIFRHDGGGDGSDCGGDKGTHNFYYYIPLT